MDLNRVARTAGIMVALLAGAWAAHAAAADDDAFAGFLAAFRAAVAADDRAELAALARMPFLYNGQWVDATEFASRVAPELFTPEVRRCLLAMRPQVEDDRYVTFCTPYAFYFGRETQGGAYRLQEFAADGEE